MLPDIQPGNTKILYFFNCLLDGMHTKIKHICDFSRCRLNARFKRSHPTFAPRPQICFIYLTEGCVLAGEENSIYCWRDLGNLQKVRLFTHPGKFLFYQYIFIYSLALSSDNANSSIKFLKVSS